MPLYSTPHPLIVLQEGRTSQPQLLSCVREIANIVVGDPDWSDDTVVEIFDYLRRMVVEFADCKLCGQPTFKHFALCPQCEHDCVQEGPYNTKAGAFCWALAMHVEHRIELVSPTVLRCVDCNNTLYLPDDEPQEMIQP